MKKFEVVIEEMLRRVVTEEADTLEDAIENVENKYDESEIVLDYEDLTYQEIRENGELTKEHTFYTYYGKSVLIEGDKNLALIKTMNKYMQDYDYVVAKKLTYNSESDIFNWEEEKHFTNIMDAIEHFGLQKEEKNAFLIESTRKDELFNRLINYVCEHCSSNTEEYEAFTNILGFTEKEMIEVGVTDYIDQRNMEDEEENEQ